MISIDQLTFHYKKQGEFFDNLTFDLEFGNIVGLLGKNGAGKSTLLKLLAGLCSPISGSIKVAGFHPFDRNPDFLGDLFMVPEEFSFQPVTIDRYLNATASLYPNFDTKKLDWILQEFELNRKSKIHSLSNGQRKKFLIAFALATNCRILILDEPTNGLDIPSKSLFRKVLVRSVTEEQLVLIATHQVKDIETILDRVVMLDQGRLVFNESLEMVGRRWQFKLVASLNGVENVIFSEKSPGGFHVIVPVSGDDESEIDLELLFNAIIHHADLKQLEYENQ